MGKIFFVIFVFSFGLFSAAPSPNAQAKKSGARVTDEQKEEVIRLFREGKSYRKISEIVGISRTAVGRCIPKEERAIKNWRYGVATSKEEKKEIQALRKAGKTHEEISKKMGINRKEIGKVLSSFGGTGKPQRKKEKLSDEQRKARRELVLGLKAEGHKRAEIAELTGLTPAQIKTVLDWDSKLRAKEPGGDTAWFYNVNYNNRSVIPPTHQAAVPAPEQPSVEDFHTGEEQECTQQLTSELVFDALPPHCRSTDALFTGGIDVRSFEIPTNILAGEVQGIKDSASDLSRDCESFTRFTVPTSQLSASNPEEATNFRECSSTVKEEL